MFSLFTREAKSRSRTEPGLEMKDKVLRFEMLPEDEWQAKLNEMLQPSFRPRIKCGINFSRNPVFSSPLRQSTLADFGGQTIWTPVFTGVTSFYEFIIPLEL